MTLPDNIFAEALNRLQQGETPQQIAQDYADYQEELVGLLAVAEMGLAIPKLTPPAPYKRQLYAEKAITSSGFVPFLQYLRLAAIPLGLVVILIGGRTAISATENSLPGDALYSIKRASEEARLTLTRDQEKVAALHVELLQKRLEEVKKAADTGNPSSETAAIAELKTQTEKTFAEATPVATANAISKQDPSLLNTLVAVNKEQKTVLSVLSEASETATAKQAAGTALENSKKNAVTLAKIIATVNDQVLTDMPNKISVTGAVANYTNNRITVEKNTFIINDKTVVTDADNQPIIDPETITGRVTITGTRAENNTLIAKQISILPVDETGAVKGETTPPATQPTQTTTPGVSTSQLTSTPSDPANQEDPADVIEPTPQAVGGYITEPNTPQYFE